MSLLNGEDATEFSQRSCLQEDPESLIGGRATSLVMFVVKGRVNKGPSEVVVHVDA